MKMIFAFALLLCFNHCFSQSTSEETETQNQTEDSTAVASLEDSVVIRVDYTEDFRGYGTGSGYVSAKKGYKFIGVYVYVSNPTKESIDVDLSNVYLLDTVNKIKYKIFSVMGTGPFTSFKRRERSLQPGKELYRKLVFAGPKDLVGQFLLYRDTLVAINNSQKEP